MTIKFHNTLSGEKEDFKSVDRDRVTMYHCGPTVYDFAHIGNLRAYVFADTLRRMLEYSGFETLQVINITDIGHLTSNEDTGDDKMVKGLRREGLPLTLDGLKKLATKYEEAFKKDLNRLNIEPPHHMPRATEYLEAEIELIKTLEEKSFAYKLPDGIYFDTAKLPNYGRLGVLTPADESATRIDKDKKSPRDFVLWKLSEDDHLGFKSPWGVGFPGWHIECSAMSRKLLGQPFDIHTGGIDHIPVHHNNEIAQSEAAYGTLLANYWLHSEFMRVSGGKMAKSENNFITLNEIIGKNFTPLAYRYYLLLSHYRTPANFSWEGMEAAQSAYRKLKEFCGSIQDLGFKIKEYEDQFKIAIENDLNTPEALAVVWKLIKDESILPADKRATLLEFDRVLGLDLEHNEFLQVPQDIIDLGNKRQLAKGRKDFAGADKIRAEIEELGYEIRDIGDSFEIRKR